MIYIKEKIHCRESKVIYRTKQIHCRESKVIYGTEKIHCKESKVIYRTEKIHCRESKVVYIFYLGPSASQSSVGNTSAASRILVVSFLPVCLFWAADLKCSRSFRLVSCSLSSDTRVRSLLRTTGSVVKGRPLNLLPCDIK